MHTLYEYMCNLIIKATCIALLEIVLIILALDLLRMSSGSSGLTWNALGIIFGICAGVTAAWEVVSGFHRWTRSKS